jgi:putative heme transporter
MSRMHEWGAGWTTALSRLSSRIAESRAERREEPEDPPPAPPPPQARPPRPVPEPVSVIPWGVRVAAEVAWRLVVLAIAVWVLMRVVSAVRLVVLAFCAALLITALLEPTVTRLKRLGLPRGLATAITFLGGFVLMGLVGWFVVWQVMENVDNLSHSVQHGINDLKHGLLNSPFHVTDKQINDTANSLSNAIKNHTDDLTSAGLQGVTVVVETLTSIVLCAFCTLFLLYDGANIWAWTLKFFPEPAREALSGAGPKVWATLTGYVRGTVIVAFIDAVCIGIGIFLLDVPMAVPLAVIIFLGAFVPLVGAVASGALAMVVALVTEGPFTALMVVVVLLAVQQIEGHILQPFILGRAVRVHPLAVVLSVASGSMIAGIGGAVVAVPLVAVLNTLVGYLMGRSRELTAALVETAEAPPAAVPATAAPPAQTRSGEPEPEADATGPAGS